MKLSENEPLDRFAKLCREIGEEERNVAIAWTLAHPVVCSAIVGIRTEEHLEGIVRAAELKQRKTPFTREASMAKVFSTEAAWSAASAA